MDYTPLSKWDVLCSSKSFSLVNYDSASNLADHKGWVKIVKPGQQDSGTDSGTRQVRFFRHFADTIAAPKCWTSKIHVYNIYICIHGYIYIYDYTWMAFFWQQKAARLKKNRRHTDASTCLSKYLDSQGWESKPDDWPNLSNWLLALMIHKKNWM